ncbi:MAG TPA: MFS transporter, partial [Polyangiaceae bacterium]|nr:MFS transporter [Polyangiaceae bacterium]
ISLGFFVTIFVSPIVFARYARAPESKRAPGWQVLRSQLTWLANDRELRAVSLIEGVTQAVSAFFVFFIVVMAVSVVHLSSAQASSLVAAKGTTFIVALFILGGLIKRLGQHRAYMVGFAAIASALAMLGFAGSAPLLWIGSLTLGVGLGAVQIATLTRYAQIGARDGYGKVSGLSALVGPSGGLFGSLFGGLLSKWVGLPGTFSIAAAGFALGLLILATRQVARAR